MILPSRFQKVDIIRKWCPSEMAASLGDFFPGGRFRWEKTQPVGEAPKNATYSPEDYLFAPEK